ncbi:hypothetical protein BHM03_00036406 [Ensete ventricosum]|nr:hypothetical protein BHM03_00036406 [Ensete ventricosum]
MYRNLPPRHRGSHYHLHTPAPFDHPHCVVATPYVGDSCLAHRQPPCQGAVAPAADSAPTGGTSTGAAPLRTGRRRVALLPLSVAPAGDRRWRLPPLAGTVDLPYGLALVAAGCPLMGRQAVVGRLIESQKELYRF